MAHANPVFEKNGWNRIDLSQLALDKVAVAVEVAGYPAESFDVSDWETAFRSYCHLPQYAGEYRIYGGAMEHCFFEKALEHFVSLILIRPRRGFVGVDIGSCKSVVPDILRNVYGCECYEQDLEYTPGVHGHRIGSNAAELPLEAGTVDFATLHCTYEHFEGAADTAFVRECGRVLKPGGKVVILPLYVNLNYCNVTGEAEQGRAAVRFDDDATYYCEIPEWRNRFGRHYSPEALVRRVLKPATQSGLTPRLYRVRNWSVVHRDLWMRWILVLERPADQRLSR